MRNLIWLFIATALFASNSALAVGDDVYTASAFVEGQSAQELDRAADEALVKLITQLTLIEDRAELAPVLEQRARLLVRSVFKERVAEQASGSEVSFEFDAQSLTQAWFETGLGLVPSSREGPLLWWVIDDGRVGTRFFDREVDTALGDALTSSLSTLGISLQWPLYDLQDAVSGPPESLWRLDRSSIVRAAMRYSTQPQWLIRWATLTDSRVIMNVYELNQERINERIAGVFASSSLALERLRMEVLSDTRARLALAPALEKNPILTIEGLRSFSDYRWVLEQLDSSVLIERVRVLELRGSTLVVELESLTSVDQLRGMISDLLGYSMSGDSEGQLTYLVPSETSP